MFLFYFSQFVDWPAAAFADERSPIVIGVLGDDPFDGALDQAVAGERVNGRPIIVRRLKSIDGCAGLPDPLHRRVGGGRSCRRS